MISFGFLASEAAVNAAEVSATGQRGTADEWWPGLWILAGLIVLWLVAAALERIFGVAPSKDPWARQGSDDEHDLFVPE